MRDEMARIVELQKRADSGRPEAIVTPASTITPRPLDPVWDGILWAGKPTLLCGDPGLGKSMVTCDIAAISKAIAPVSLLPPPARRKEGGR